MTGQLWTGRLTGPDGATLDVRDAVYTPAPTVPPPVPTTPPPPALVVPAGANQVRIGTATYPLAAVDPTRENNPLGFGSADWNGRGTSQLVAYTPAVDRPGSRTGTNQHGVEVEVTPASTVGTVTEGLAGGTLVPAPGLVLSGHGTAAVWLLTNCRPGVKVVFGKVDAPAPAPQSPPGPVVVTEPPPARTVAGYLMDGRDVAEIPPCYNQVRVAFMRMSGGELTPVEWGGKKPAETQAQLTRWAKPGVREVLLSEGGSKGGYNLSDVAGFVRGFRRYAPLYAATGLDFDEEGGDLNVTNAVAIAKDLAKGREKTFTVSFVPPGGPPVDVYMRAAVACKQAGLRVQFGFQGYDAVDTDDEILGRTADAVAKLGQESVVVGFMVGDDDAHRTPDEIESLMRKVVTRWKNIGGAYAWHIQADRTTDAMTRVARILGVAA
jgi:hypothetical protein